MSFGRLGSLGRGFGRLGSSAKKGVVVNPGSPYTLTASTGSFILTGDDMAPLVDRKLPSDVGAFTLTGVAATLTKSGGPTFVYAGQDDAFTAGQGSSSAYTSTTIDIGAATSDRFVIVAAADQNANPLTSITVNTVSLTQQITDGVTSGRIWSGLVGATGGAGVASIVVTYTGAGFTDRAIFVYVGRGMANTTGAATTAGTAGASPTSFNISVAAGDLLVTANRFTRNYSTSTQAPTATTTSPAGSPLQSAYWNTISATNASFSVALGGAGDACAATFR